MRGKSFDSGHEALREIRRASHGEDPFEVAIVDLMMPEMDGAAVAGGRACGRGSARHRRHPPHVGRKICGGHTGRRRGDGQTRRPSQLFDVLQTVLAHRVAAAPLSTRRSPAVTRGNGARVLVVDDNAANQKVALRMVERLGYRADVAGTGAEAVTMLGRGHYDAAHRLPDAGDGRLRGDAADPPQRARRSARADHRDDRRRGFGRARAMPRAGMDDYITKPIKLHVVAAVLDAGWPTREAV